MLALKLERNLLTAWGQTVQGEHNIERCSEALRSERFDDSTNMALPRLNYRSIIQESVTELLSRLGM
jgi:hypothetical protein